MINYKVENKETSLILCIFGGYLGLHHFYNKKIGLGLLYLFTVGLFYVGWIIDIIKIAKLKDYKSINSTNIKKCLYCGKINNINDKFCQECGNSLLNKVEIDLVPEAVWYDSYMKRKTNEIVKDYVVFDTETTGLNPSYDKIIEISAIKFINNKKVDTFSTLINPKVVIEPFITQLTGIKQEDLKDKPTINEVIPKFFEFIEDLTLVAHNAPYDIKMMASECYRNKIELCNNKIIDTVTLAKRIIPRENIENYKLTTLKEYLGLEYGSHRALDDCETCSKVYQLYLNLTQKKKIVILDENTGEVIEELN